MCLLIWLFSNSKNYSYRRMNGLVSTKQSITILGKKGFGPERIRFCLDNAQGQALADKTQKLSFYITSKDTVNLVFKDLGMQISWTTVFLVEYFGPILITVLLLAFREQIYGSNPPLLYVQKVGVAMTLIHYLKREYETLFVHRFSNDTMPWTNIIKNSTHYWAIFGFLAMYFFLRPDYTPPSWVKHE